MEQWRIDIFGCKDGSVTLTFEDQYDAIKNAIKVAQKEPMARIFLLEKIYDDKYELITQLYDGKEET